MGPASKINTTFGWADAKGSSWNHSFLSGHSDLVGAQIPERNPAFLNICKHQRMNESKVWICRGETRLPVPAQMHASSTCRHWAGHSACLGFS